MPAVSLSYEPAQAVAAREALAALKGTTVLYAPGEHSSYDQMLYRRQIMLILCEEVTLFGLTGDSSLKEERLWWNSSACNSGNDKFSARLRWQCC
jgi:hypothetical protein